MVIGRFGNKEELKEESLQKKPLEVLTLPEATGLFRTRYKHHNGGAAYVYSREKRHICQVFFNTAIIYTSELSRLNPRERWNCRKNNSQR